MDQLFESKCFFHFGHAHLFFLISQVKDFFEDCSKVIVLKCSKFRWAWAIAALSSNHLRLYSTTLNKFHFSMQFSSP